MCKQQLSKCTTGDSRGEIDDDDAVRVFTSRSFFGCLFDGCKLIKQYILSCDIFSPAKVDVGTAVDEESCDMFRAASSSCMQRRNAIPDSIDGLSF